MKGDGWGREGWFQKALAEGIWHQKLNCFVQGPVLSGLSPGVPTLAAAVTSRAEKGHGKSSFAAGFAAAAERLQVKLPCRKEGFTIREVQFGQVAVGNLNQTGGTKAFSQGIQVLPLEREFSPCLLNPGGKNPKSMVFRQFGSLFQGIPW